MPLIPTYGHYTITPNQGEFLVGRIGFGDLVPASTLAAAEDFLVQSTLTTRPRSIVWYFTPDGHVRRHSLTGARERRRFYLARHRARH
jgi:hypothetical protein